MFVLKTIIFAASLACITSQHNGPTTTPVPILKQINKQNDDGSYSYGYEAADGSFKIETKYPNGDVAGKYGYVDESGKSREISYGASSQRGFEPQGSGIMVPPPTVYDPTSSNALTDGQEDDGQYREDPKIYEDPKYNSRSQARQPASLRQFQSATAAPEPQYQRETIRQQAQPQYQQQQYQPTQYQAQQQYQPTQYQAQQHFQPTQTSQFRSGPLYTQQGGLFDQGPQQFTQGQTQTQIPQAQSQFTQPQQQYRPQSQIYHQQPQFSYQANIPQPQYSGQNYQEQNYQSNQNFNPFAGHPAQNFDPNTGSYSINFTG